MHNTCIILWTLLHLWCISCQLSMCRSGVKRKSMLLKSCLNCCVAHLCWSCQICNGASLWIPTLALMPQVLCCKSMMMGCTLLRFIRWSTIPLSATTAPATKNYLLSYRPVPNGIADLKDYHPSFTPITNPTRLCIQSLSCLEDRLIGWNDWWTAHKDSLLSCTPECCSWYSIMQTITRVAVLVGQGWKYLHCLVA